MSKLTMNRVIQKYPRHPGKHLPGKNTTKSKSSDNIFPISGRNFYQRNVKNKPKMNLSKIKDDKVYHRYQTRSMTRVTHPAQDDKGTKEAQIKEMETSSKRQHPDEDIDVAVRVSVNQPDPDNSADNVGNFASPPKTARGIDTSKNDSNAPVAVPNPKVPASGKPCPASKKGKPSASCASKGDRNQVFIDIGPDSGTGGGPTETNGFRMHKKTRDAAKNEETEARYPKVQNGQVQIAVRRAAGEEILIPDLLSWMQQELQTGHVFLMHRNQAIPLRPNGRISNSNICENGNSLTKSTPPTSVPSGEGGNAVPTVSTAIQPQPALNNSARSKTSMESMTVESVDRSNNAGNSNEKAGDGKLIDIGAEVQVADEDFQVVWVCPKGNMERMDVSTVSKVEERNSNSKSDVAAVPNLSIPFFRPWLPVDEVIRPPQTESNCATYNFNFHVENVDVLKEIRSHVDKLVSDLTQRHPPSAETLEIGGSDTDDDIKFLGFYKQEDDDTVSEVGSEK